MLLTAFNSTDLVIDCYHTAADGQFSLLVHDASHGVQLLLRRDQLEQLVTTAQTALVRLMLNEDKT